MNDEIRTVSRDVGDVDGMAEARGRGKERGREESDSRRERSGVVQGRKQARKGKF